MSIAYYNGVFKKPEEMRIPLTDRSIFFGDGIYDAAIGRNGHIYMKREHIDRFYSNAERLNIPLFCSREEFDNLLCECIFASGEGCYFVYFQLTRYSEERRHECENKASNLLITVTPIEIPSPAKTISLSLFEDKRYSYCNIKTLNLLPSVLASNEAKERGFDEAVFHRGNTITECAHSNISILKNGELYTHPTNEHILAGTARKKMIDVCLDMGIICHDTPFSIEDLFSADEILVTSSTKLCRRAFQVENKKFDLKNSSIGMKICNIMNRDFMDFT